MSNTWPTNKQLAKRLDLALQNPSHAYIFSGQPGYGARLLADAFAAQILGVEFSAKEPDIAHPNITYIQPMDGKKKISISHIHSLIYSALQTKFNPGVPRIFIIDRADQLSHEAATALLKTLEEPNGDTIFLLTTYSLHSVLPTIRSRAVTLTLPILSNNEIQQYLSKNLAISQEEATRIADLATGKIELAVQLSEQEKLEDFVKETEQARQFAMGSLSKKLAIAKRVIDEQQAADFLDRLYYTLPGESSILVTAFNQERIMQAEKQIGSNVNQRFVLENLALQWSN